MGIQGANIGELAGASVLVIDQTCENSQLLISLCRNGKDWLSPIGWTEKQKITLLDCRSIDGKTEIDIPAEFAKTLVAGDKLLLKCSELDFTQELIWEAQNFQTRPVVDTSAAGLTSGFLSRFKSPKPMDITDSKSEAQRRAEDADRAAESYRVKMEAATAAKEEAQRKALEAARDAEAALKMEAERIAEMERAAKAFEEAERLKQDELRRVEEERRIEEARLAEEARRIEEAKKREAEAIAERERKAALERYVAALDVTHTEETRLQSRLTDLKSDSEALESQKSAQSAHILTLNEDLEAAEKRVNGSRESFEKTAKKLEGLTTTLTNLQSKSDSLSYDQEQLNERLTSVEADYLTAQREAEMASVRAEEKRHILEIARLDKETILENLSSVSKDLETEANLVSAARVKTQKLQSKYETAQVNLEHKRVELETAQSNIADLSDSVQTSRIEIEATQQAVEDCRARQSAHQSAVAHLEAGGDPNSIPETHAPARVFANDDTFYNDGETTEDSVDNAMPSGLLGRVKRNFLRHKDAEISIDVDDVSFEELSISEPDFSSQTLADELADDGVADDELSVDRIDNEEIGLAPSAQTKSFLHRHRTSFLAIGTLLGGAAILGGGYLTTKNSPQTLSVKTSPPAPIKAVNIIGDIKTPSGVMPVSEPLVDTPLIKVAEAEIPNIPIPNLTFTALSLETAHIKKEGVKEPRAKNETTEKDLVNQVPSKTTPIEQQRPEKTQDISSPKKAVVKNYPELTTRIQTQLRTLGFYSGDLNGLQSSETKEAIKSFQELYGLPQDGRISGKFLTALTNAESQQKTARKYALAKAAVPVSTAVIYDTPRAATLDSAATSDFAATSDSVLSDSLPAAQNDTAPKITEQAPVISQEATAPIITSPPSTAPLIESVPVAPAPEIAEVQDVIVEAQRTRAAKAVYPKVAENKKYFVDAKIIVSYDIDAKGKVINTKIVSNDHSGRFSGAFEKAAMTAVKRQRFLPKTVNGEAVMSNGLIQRITFKAG